MKIAVVTDDGATISPHFGRARSYLVLTVEAGVITGRELRVKPSPHLDGGERHGDRDEGHTGPVADAKHDAMLAPVMDCVALVARGMGRGAWERITGAGITPYVTDVADAEVAALACASGSLAHHGERLH